MYRMTRIRALLTLMCLVAIAVVSWLGHKSLDIWTRERLLAQQRQRLAELPAPGAASIVKHLAADDHSLRLVVRSLEDARPQVADAAETGLSQMIARWKAASAEKASPQVAELAAALAQRSGNLPIERRSFAHALANQLLEWPIDSQEVDAGRLLADCETVLRQPLAAQSPLRLAAHVVEPEVAAASSPKPGPALSRGRPKLRAREFLPSPSHPSPAHRNRLPR